MYIICTLDEARNLPDYLFNKFYCNKEEVLRHFSKHTTQIILSTHDEQYSIYVVALGYEPTGLDVFKYSEREAQDRLLEIMLCG